jgi:hypothetical protein
MLGVDDIFDDDSDDCESKDNDSSTSFFLKHLRKCFIATDDYGYCESALIPDLQIFTPQTRENSTNPPQSSPTTANITNNEIKMLKILNKRIRAGSYDYIKINKQPNKSQRQQIKLISSFTSKADNKSDNDDQKKNNNNDDYDDDDDDKKAKQNDSNSTTTDQLVDKKPQIIFEPKVIPNVKTREHSIVSPLTSLLLNNDLNHDNNFIIYQKYEYEGNNPNEAKHFKIYLPMCSVDTKNNIKFQFIKISINKNANISDLIGLICYKYILNKMTPPLKYESVKNYQLKIADGGEIESEFGPLEPTKKVGIFGFTDLALVETVSSPSLTRAKETRQFEPDEGYNVYVHFGDGKPSKLLQYKTDNILMRQIYNELCQLKIDKDIFCPSIKYRIENINEPNIMVDLNAKLSHFQKYEFYFFRQNSVLQHNQRRQNAVGNLKIDVTEKIAKINEYRMKYLSKWRHADFKIELTNDSFELEEIKSTNSISSKALSNFYSIPIENIVDCYEMESKNQGMKRIRVVIVDKDTKVDNSNRTIESNDTFAEYASSFLSYRHLDFECKLSLAKDFVTTLRYFIVYRNSFYMRHYDDFEKMKSSIKWSRKSYIKSNKNMSIYL